MPTAPFRAIHASAHIGPPSHMQQLSFLSLSLLRASDLKSIAQGILTYHFPPSANHRMGTCSVHHVPCGVTILNGCSFVRDAIGCSHWVFHHIQ
eukprot:6429037-Amphidinium_carterae.1